MKAQHREARREVEGQEGGTSWTPSSSPSVLRQPKAQEWMAVSLSPRPLAGGSDKSFKSSFYAGRESLWERGAPCQKAPAAPTQTAYTPLADHPSHAAASPGPGLSAPRSLHLCSLNPRASHITHAVVLPESPSRRTRG